MSPHRHYKPPRLAAWLLKHVLPDGGWQTPLGDFEEYFNAVAAHRGRGAARLWYWGQVLNVLPRKLFHSAYWGTIMVANYLKIAFRTLAKRKGFAFINIAGLAVGMACCFFILLWVQDELSYDRFHAEGDQIYRVMRHNTFGETKWTTTAVPKPLDDVFNDQYPEIINSVLMDWSENMVLTHDDHVFRAAGLHFDPDVFDVFTFPLIVGNPSTALLDPESITISASLASRFFGRDWRTSEDVLGTVIRVDNRIDMKLTGVFEDVPKHSSIQFEFILPMKDFLQQNEWVESWKNSGLNMFVRLREDADPAQVNAKIKDLIDEHVDVGESDVWLQPFKDVYLRSSYEDGVLVGGRIDYIRIFTLVGIFILLIASINFMNLATARSATRAREIGVRRSFGATKSLLARQFLGESILTALVALVFAIGIVLLLLPSFNELTNKAVSLSLVDARVWLWFVGLALLTGLLAGSYPALYLSSLNVVGALRSRTASQARGGSLRKGLVVFQFVMSIVLIVGTLTVYRQLDFIRSKDLGVDRDNVVYMDFEGGIRQQFDTFKQELLKEPGIVNAATASSNPLAISDMTLGPRWDGKQEEDKTAFSVLTVGYDFIETMKIDLITGRHFSEAFGADSSSFIINETAARAMSMDEPLGQRLALWGREGTIIGVVKDFHMQSFYSEIKPVIFRLVSEEQWTLFVRIAGGQTSEALAGLERVYNKFNPDYPFHYRFMDEEYEEMYRSEIVIGTLANYFAVLAVLIACLGLFGLASFTAERRRREIGIRKVLGASVSSVVLLLSRDFILLVVWAFVVAAPLSYFLMTDWLNEFTFHIGLGFGLLAIAGLASVLIAWLTVSYQSVKAALANPVDALKYE